MADVGECSAERSVQSMYIEGIERNMPGPHAPLCSGLRVWSQSSVSGPVSGSVMGSVSGFRLRSGLRFDLWFGLVGGVRVSVEKEEW